MQSFVWFVSAWRIWTGAILWALENEPEQIVVCCTGWKKDREGLSCSEEPKKTRLQVTLYYQSQRQGPPSPRPLLNVYIHVSICTPPHTTITTIPVSQHFVFLFLPRPPPFSLPAWYPVQTLCPDKVITTYLEKQIYGVVPWTDSSSQLGRNKNFPNCKCSASLN